MGDVTNHYCERGCGKVVSSGQRHTCIHQPGGPEPVEVVRGRLVADALQHMPQQVTTKETLTGLFAGRLVIIESDELAELRRKCAHYHTQRVEADERIAKLEDVLDALAQAVEFTLRCESQNAPDGHCVVAAEHRMLLESNLDAARRLLQ